MPGHDEGLTAREQARLQPPAHGPLLWRAEYAVEWRGHPAGTLVMATYRGSTPHDDWRLTISRYDRAALGAVASVDLAPADAPLPRDAWTLHDPDGVPRDAAWRTGDPHRDGRSCVTAIRVREGVAEIWYSGDPSASERRAAGLGTTVSLPAPQRFLLSLPLPVTDLLAGAARHAIGDEEAAGARESAPDDARATRLPGLQAGGCDAAARAAFSPVHLTRPTPTPLPAGLSETGQAGRGPLGSFTRQGPLSERTRTWAQLTEEGDVDASQPPSLWMTGTGLLARRLTWWSPAH